MKKALIALLVAGLAALAYLARVESVDHVSYAIDDKGFVESMCQQDCYGQPHGTEVSYYESGKIRSIVTWRHGVWTSRKLFNADGLDVTP